SPTPRPRELGQGISLERNPLPGPEDPLVSKRGLFRIGEPPLYTKPLALACSYLQPPAHDLPRREHWRWLIGIRAIAAYSRGLDRDLPVAAEIAVADPDPAVRRRLAGPRDLYCLSSPPSQARMVDLA